MVLDSTNCNEAFPDRPVLSKETFALNETIRMGNIEYSIRMEDDNCQDWQLNSTIVTCDYWIENECFIVNDDSCRIRCNPWLTIGAPTLAIAVCCLLAGLVLWERRSHHRTTDTPRNDAMSVIPQCSDSVVAELTNSFPEQYPSQPRKYSGPVDLDDIIEDDNDVEAVHGVSNASSDDDAESRFTNSTPVISNRWKSRKPKPMLLKEITVEAEVPPNSVNTKTVVPVHVRPPKQPDGRAIFLGISKPAEEGNSKPPSTGTRSAQNETRSHSTAAVRVGFDGDQRSFCSEPSRPKSTQIMPSTRSVASEPFEPETNIEL